MDRNNAKLSHKKRKAQIKKQKRKLKRRMLAESHKNDVVPDENNESCEESEALSDEEEKRIQNLIWLQREKEAQELFKAKKDKEENDRIQKENEKILIREQFEKEKQKLDLVSATRATKVITEKKESPKVWHNPEPPDGYDEDKDIKNICPFFQKVGVCRFGMSCSRIHPPSGVTTVIMFPGMFASFGMEHIIHAALDSDVNLEYDDQDTYDDFKTFYEETYPEFRKIGRIRSFHVCSNYEPHLKGNVYIEYSRKFYAEEAYRMFNGRWFDKRQLSCQFVNIDNWASAICGLFDKNKCPKGKHCNFLHIFKCPKNLEVSRRVHNNQEMNLYRSNGDKSRSPSKNKHRSKKSRSRSSHRTRSRSRSTRSSSHKNRSSKGSSHKSRSRSRSSRGCGSKRSSHGSRSRNGLSRKSDSSNRSTSNRSLHRSRSKSSSRYNSHKSKNSDLKTKYDGKKK